MNAVKHRNKNDVGHRLVRAHAEGYAAGIEAAAKQLDEWARALKIDSDIQLAIKVRSHAAAIRSLSPPERTECCREPIKADQRYCPKCGWEARIESQGVPSGEPVSEERIREIAAEHRYEGCGCGDCTQKLTEKAIRQAIREYRPVERVRPIIEELAAIADAVCNLYQNRKQPDDTAIMGWDNANLTLGTLRRARAIRSRMSSKRGKK